MPAHYLIPFTFAVSQFTITISFTFTLSHSGIFFCMMITNEAYLTSLAQMFSVLSVSSLIPKVIPVTIYS